MDTAADHGGCLLADRFPARLVIGDLLEIRASWILDRVDRWPVLYCCIVESPLLATQRPSGTM